MRDEIASLNKIIGTLATKEEFESLKKAIEELKSRVSHHDQEIATLKELLAALKDSLYNNPGASSNEIMLLRNRVSLSLNINYIRYRLNM